MGRRHGAILGQVALAWLLARKPWVVPIPGTTKSDHLEKNLGAARVRLAGADMADIEKGFARIGERGAKCPLEYSRVATSGPP